jgi:tetratricopeptide (TPR) repeat protein
MTGGGINSGVVRGCVWAAVAMLAALTAVAGGPEKIELPNPAHTWIEVRTANFRFFSNAGTSATRRVAADLEELRAVLAQLTAFELQSPVPTLIYVFKNDRMFTPYKILYDNQPGVMSGYFIPARDANYIAIDAGSDDASAIVFHEYVHYVTANNFWWLPVWLSEGLAEFYETFEVVDDTAFIGLPIPRYLATLHGSTLVPLSDLLAVDYDSPYYNEKDRKSDFYAQSWALTHYLLLGDPERRQQLGRFVASVGGGTPAEIAFADAFGPDLELLDRQVRAHLRGPRISFLKARTEVDVDQSMTITEMPYADVLFRLGDLLSVQMPERPEAVSFFEAALEADPGHSPSLTALALAAEERADWDAAANYYARAVQANPNDAEAQFHWGEFLSRRGDDLQPAIAALTAATRIQGSFAPAWAALSRLYVQLGDTSPAALAAAQAAHRLEPADRTSTLGLLRLYVRLDMRDQAADLIETALRSDPRAAGEAWTVVLLNDLLRARELLHEDRAVDASERLDTAERSADLAARPESVARDIADIRRSIAEHEGAKTYDLAVAKYEDGDREGARELLEHALSGLPDQGPVTASCRQLLRVIDHPEEYVREPEPVLSPTADEVEQLNRMLAVGDLEGAVLFLKEIRGRTSGAQARWIDGKIGELEWTLTYNRYVESYNRAVDLYNRQDFDGVVAVLDPLLATLPEGPQASSVRALIGDARAALAKRSNVQR